MIDGDEVDHLQEQSCPPPEWAFLASSMSGLVCAPLPSQALTHVARILYSKILRAVQGARLDRDFARPAFTAGASGSTTKGTT